MEGIPFTTGGRQRGVIYPAPPMVLLSTLSSTTHESKQIDHALAPIATGLATNTSTPLSNDSEQTATPNLTADIIATPANLLTALPSHDPSPHHLLCVLKVPSYMIPTDLVRHFGGIAEHILGMRVLRRTHDHSESVCEDDYCVLLEVVSEAAAENLIDSFHDRPFSSLDSTLCSIKRVSHIDLPPNLARDFSSRSSASAQASLETDCITSHSFVMEEGSAAEFCTVCLDALLINSSDAIVRTLFTTFCGHCFHADCMARLESAACPVCRFQHDSPDATLSECAACGWRGSGSSTAASNDDDLWVCVLCGFIGCGARRGDHIKKHYEDTLHTYSVNTCTNAVYDFAGGGFVHRLILQRSDSANEVSGVRGAVAKIVEVASPGMGVEDEDDGGWSKLCRAITPSLSRGREEELVSRRLETAAYMHNQELAWRLDRHRQTLETRLQRHRSFIAIESAVGSGAGSWASRAKQHLMTEKSKLVRQLEASSARLEATRKEVAMLSELRESLGQNNLHWRELLSGAQRGLMEEEKYSRSVLPPLENTVRELMTKLDIKSSDEKEV